MSIYNSGYTGEEIDAGIEKAATAHQDADFTDKTTRGISITSDFDVFKFLGFNNTLKVKFDRSVLNEMARQTRNAQHYNANADNMKRPGIYYGALNPIPSIFNDAPGASAYHHVYVDGENDVYQFITRNGHNTIGIRNGSQSFYTELRPIRSPLYINSSSGTSLTTYTNNLYRFDSEVTNLAITLPNTNLNFADRVEFVFSTGSNPIITFTEPNSNPIVYQTGYNIEANKTYKITAEWLGNKWLVSYITIG